MSVIESPAPDRADPARDAVGMPVFLALGIYSIVLVALTLLKNQLSLGGLWTAGAHQQRSLDLQFFNGFSDAPLWWGPWVNALLHSFRGADLCAAAGGGRGARGAAQSGLCPADICPRVCQWIAGFLHGFGSVGRNLPPTTVPNASSQLTCY